jgi:hypothetical protein
MKFVIKGEYSDEIDESRLPTHRLSRYNIHQFLQEAAAMLRQMLNWTGWQNPYAVAYMLVMLGTLIFIWLVPDEYLYE